MTYKFIDLFAGIGGFHEAAKISDYNMECVFASEINVAAAAVYETNHNIKVNGDITKVEEKDIPDHDILFAGFPCQPFSFGGHKKGFKDASRGNLFFDIVRIVEEKRPKYFILENVKGILSNDNGNTIKTINETIKELGYITTEYNLQINSREVGIPQNRDRVYFLGIRSDLVNKDHIVTPPLNHKPEHMDFDFKGGEKVPENINLYITAWGEFIKKVKRPTNRTLPVIWTDFLNSDMSYQKEDMSKWRRKYIDDMKNIYSTNHDFIDKWLKKYNVAEWPKREKKMEWQAGRDVYDINDTMLQLRQSGYRFSAMTHFPALVAMVQVPILVKQRKYLSLTEAAYLQQFPANFKFGANENESYKQLGNAVTVEVIRQLINHIVKFGEEHGC